MLKMSKLNITYRFVMLLILLLSMQNIAFAVDYYADVEITINEAGTALVSGISNHKFFEESSNDKIVSKTNGYWTLKLLPNEIFSNYIFKVVLPEDSQINYIKSNGNPIITSDKSIQIIETGENDIINLTIQYQIVKDQTQDFSIILLVVASIIVIMIVSFYIMKKKKPNKQIQEHEDLSIGLTERQARIYNIVKDHKEIAQHKIGQIMQIPKSSISRNIDSLVRKGIIKKFNLGNMNLIKLKKTEDKPKD